MVCGDLKIFEKEIEEGIGSKLWDTEKKSKKKIN